MCKAIERRGNLILSKLMNSGKAPGKDDNVGRRYVFAQNEKTIGCCTNESYTRCFFPRQKTDLHSLICIPQVK